MPSSRPDQRRSERSRPGSATMATACRPKPSRADHRCLLPKIGYAARRAWTISSKPSITMVGGVRSNPSGRAIPCCICVGSCACPRRAFLSGLRVATVTRCEPRRRVCRFGNEPEVGVPVRLGPTPHEGRLKIGEHLRKKVTKSLISGVGGGKNLSVCHLIIPSWSHNNALDRWSIGDEETSHANTTGMARHSFQGVAPGLILAEASNASFHEWRRRRQPMCQMPSPSARIVRCPPRPN